MAAFPIASRFASPQIAASTPRTRFRRWTMPAGGPRRGVDEAPIRCLVAALAVLLHSWAPEATAQEQIDPALAQAAAEQLISKAKAEGLFAPGAWDHGPTVRHERSGMICRFVQGEASNS